MTPENPAVIPVWVVVVGVLITWGGFAIAVMRFRIDVKRIQEDEEMRRQQERRDRDQELEKMAKRVCLEFHHDHSTQLSRDQRIRELAGVEIDGAFRDRASSFVASERYNADNAATNKRLETLELALRENTRELGNMGGQITAAVTQQLTAYLSSTVFAGKNEQTNRK